MKGLGLCISVLKIVVKFEMKVEGVRYLIYSLQQLCTLVILGKLWFSMCRLLERNYCCLIRYGM